VTSRRRVSGSGHFERMYCHPQDLSKPRRIKCNMDQEKLGFSGPYRIKIQVDHIQLGSSGPWKIMGQVNQIELGSSEP